MAIQVEAMMHDLKFKKLTHSSFDLLDAGIAKFDHLTTLHTDQVIMLLV